MKSRILIADDHWAIRQALAEVISRLPDAEVIAEASDGVRALELVKQTIPDLIVLDVSLPLLRGMQVLKQMRALESKTSVLIFTMYPADQYAEISRRWGAQGFVSKDADEASIVSAISAVLAGELVFPKTTRRSESARKKILNNGSIDLLSEREMEVFRSLTRGETNKSIAVRLKLSPKSITTYRDRLFAKLQVENIAELCSLAAREGVL